MGMTRGRSPDYWIELFGNFFFFFKKKMIDWLVVGLEEQWRRRGGGGLEKMRGEMVTKVVKWEIDWVSGSVLICS
jgi:hypothetical protein